MRFYGRLMKKRRTSFWARSVVANGALAVIEGGTAAHELEDTNQVRLTARRGS